jgi:hypothetical protein
MNLGKKLAEGYAVDTESTEIDEPRTGPIVIVTDEVLAEAPAEPVTA